MSTDVETVHQPKRRAGRPGLSRGLRRGLRWCAGFVITFAAIHYGFHFVRVFGAVKETGLLQRFVANWDFQDLNPTSRELWWLRGATVLSVYTLLAATVSAASRLTVRRWRNPKARRVGRPFADRVRIGSFAVMLACLTSLFIIDSSPVHYPHPAEVVVASYLEMIGDGRFLDAFDRLFAPWSAESYRRSYLELLGAGGLAPRQRFSVHSVEIVLENYDEGYVVVMARYEQGPTDGEDTRAIHRTQHYIVGWVGEVDDAEDAGWRIVSIESGCPSGFVHCEGVPAEQDPEVSRKGVGDP